MAPDSLATGVPHVWCVPLDDSAPAAPYLSGLLSPDETRRIGSIRHERRARRIASRGLLRLAAAAYVGCAPETLRIVTGPFGKPEFHGQPLAASVSHSGDLLLLAFAHGRPIGVDIEGCATNVDVEQVVWPELTDAERAVIAPLPGAARRRAALEAWVRVEAAAKAAGDGLLTSIGARQRARERYECAALEVGAGYVAAVATAGAPVQPVCWRFSGVVSACEYFRGSSF